MPFFASSSPEVKEASPPVQERFIEGMTKEDATRIVSNLYYINVSNLSRLLRLKVHGNTEMMDKVRGSVKYLSDEQIRQQVREGTGVSYIHVALAPLVKELVADFGAQIKDPKQIPFMKDRMKRGAEFVVVVESFKKSEQLFDQSMWNKLMRASEYGAAFVDKVKQIRHH